MNTKVSLIVGVLVVIVAAILWAATDINVGLLALLMVAASVAIVASKLVVHRRS